MKTILNLYSLGLLLLAGAFNTVFAIDAPSGFLLKQKGQSVNVTWNSVPDAQGYKLYYAPYPVGSPVNSIDNGSGTGFSVEISTCVAYYVAVTAYRNSVKTDDKGQVVLDDDGNEVFIYEESAYSGIKIVKEINPSFFPIHSCSGELSSNSWTYELNHGDFLVQNSSLFPADIEFGVADISVDVKNVLLHERFSGNFVNEGNNVGSFIEDRFNILNLSGETSLGTKITDFRLNQILNNTELGLASEIDIFSSLRIEPNDPVSWPLSREDLHLVALGSVLASSMHTGVSTNINVLFSKPVMDERAISQDINFESSWVLSGKMESMTVKDENYYNVVKVTNVINGESIGPTGEIENLDRKSTYWLSRGVGMIKGTGQFNIINTAVLGELDSYSVR